jgi:gluconokinase
VAVAHPNVVFMGVCGCGKSTVARRYADVTRLVLVEADDFHPAANVAKMQAGQPLTDEDRAGWLAALARRITEGKARGEGMVLTCSALKRAYRDRLRQADPDLFFVHLAGTRELLSSRLGVRQGHFMPASLLDSQLAALEAPQAPAERCLTVDIAAAPEVLCATVATFLQTL